MSLFPYWSVERLGTRMFKKFGSKEATDSDNIGQNFTHDEPLDGIEDADIVTSRGTDDYHYPVLDLDIDTMYVESSTEGHAHLYINHPVGWTDYVNLLKALEKCGILQTGYVDFSIERGYSAVRLPWVNKYTTEQSLEEKNAG